MRLLLQFGATPGAALLAGTLIGPAQVAARVIEAGWLSRYHPLASTRLATVMNPLGIIILAIGGPVLAPVFAIFYGAGNGILTIARLLSAIFSRLLTRSNETKLEFRFGRTYSVVK